MDSIIRGAELVIPYSGVKKLDIGITSGKISHIGTNIEDAQATVIDAQGLHLFPGAIDGHSHYGVYGDADWLATDYRRTSRSSAVGGVTTVINFMRSERSYLQQLPEEIAIGERESVIDFSFHLGVMMDKHLEEMPQYVQQYGAQSFKLYLGYRGLEKSRFGTDRLLDDELLLDIYQRMNEISDDLILCIHCENVEMGRHFKKKYADDPDQNHLVYYDRYNPGIVETENVIRVSYLAKQYGAKITIVHCSAGTSVDALSELPWFDPELVHVETCPHYLLETVGNAKGLGGVVKPPLRSKTDNEKLWNGIQQGIVTFIGTDHVSICWDEKFAKGYDIQTCKLGFGGAEFMFPQILSEGHFGHGLPLEKIAEITSANTAKTYNLYPRKGAIEVGSDADLVLVDLSKKQTITPELIAINSDFSLYEGREVQGWPVLTMRRGEVIAKDGKTVPTAGNGEYLRRPTRPK